MPGTPTGAVTAALRRHGAEINRIGLLVGGAVDDADTATTKADAALIGNGLRQRNRHRRVSGASAGGERIAANQGRPWLFRRDQADEAFHIVDLTDRHGWLGTAANRRSQSRRYRDIPQHAVPHALTGPLPNPTLTWNL